MRAQFGNVGLPCLCPVVAHVLFFPLAAAERIPVVMQGVEEVQLAVMSYVMRNLQGGQRGHPEPRLRRSASRPSNFWSWRASPPEPADPFSW